MSGSSSSSSGEARFKILRDVGAGASGTVHLVADKMTSAQYVMKKIPTESVAATPRGGATPGDDFERVMAEVRAMSRLDHPNVVRFKTSFITDESVCIVMEKCERSLEDVIEQAKRERRVIPESVLVEWLTELLCALAHLHANKIIHRDIKPSNVFLSKRNHVKLGDFGVCKHGGSASRIVAKSIIGTPKYIAPEVLDGEQYDVRSDVWSLGVLFYELSSLKMPFDGENFLAVVASICAGEFAPLPSHLDRRFTKIISAMLVVDPDRRATVDQLLSSYLRLPKSHPSHPSHKAQDGRAIQREYGPATVLEPAPQPGTAPPAAGPDGPNPAAKASVSSDSPSTASHPSTAAATTTVQTSPGRFSRRPATSSEVSAAAAGARRAAAGKQEGTTDTATTSSAAGGGGLEDTGDTAKISELSSSAGGGGGGKSDTLGSAAVSDTTTAASSVSGDLGDSPPRSAGRAVRGKQAAVTRRVWGRRDSDRSPPSGHAPSAASPKKVPKLAVGGLAAGVTPTKTQLASSPPKKAPAASKKQSASAASSSGAGGAAVAKKSHGDQPPAERTPLQQRAAQAASPASEAAMAARAAQQRASPKPFQQGFAGTPPPARQRPAAAASSDAQTSPSPQPQPQSRRSPLPTSHQVARQHSGSGGVAAAQAPSPVRTPPPPFAAAGAHDRSSVSPLPSSNGAVGRVMTPKEHTASLNRIRQAKSKIDIVQLRRNMRQKSSDRGDEDTVLVPTGCKSESPLRPADTTSSDASPVVVHRAFHFDAAADDIGLGDSDDAAPVARAQHADPVPLQSASEPPAAATDRSSQGRSDRTSSATKSAGVPTSSASRVLPTLDAESTTALDPAATDDHQASSSRQESSTHSTGTSGAAASSSPRSPKLTPAAKVRAVLEAAGRQGMTLDDMDDVLQAVHAFKIEHFGLC